MNNSDFRSLLASSASARPSSGGASAASVAASSAFEDGEGGKKEKGQHKQRSKPGAAYLAKKAAREEKTALAEGYRDRAEERRKGVANPAAEEEARIAATIDYERSKFLGGDLAHTHLVKGLDYALLQKMRAEMHHSSTTASSDADADSLPSSSSSSTAKTPAPPTAAPASTAGGGLGGEDAHGAGGRIAFRTPQAASIFRAAVDFNSQLKRGMAEAAEAAAEASGGTGGVSREYLQRVLVPPDNPYARGRRVYEIKLVGASRSSAAEASVPTTASSTGGPVGAGVEPPTLIVRSRDDVGAPELGLFDRLEPRLMRMLEEALSLSLSPAGNNIKGKASKKKGGGAGAGDEPGYAASAAAAAAGPSSTEAAKGPTAAAEDSDDDIFAGVGTYHAKRAADDAEEALEPAAAGFGALPQEAGGGGDDIRMGDELSTAVPLPPLPPPLPPLPEGPQPPLPDADNGGSGGSYDVTGPYPGTEGAYADAYPEVPPYPEAEASDVVGPYPYPYPAATAYPYPPGGATAAYPPPATAAASLPPSTAAAAPPPSRPAGFVGARRAPASDPLASGGIKGGIMGEDTSYDLGPSDAAGPDSDRYATVAFDEEAAEAEEEARRAARAAARLAAAQAQAAAAAAAKRAAAGGDLLADLDEVEVEGDSSSSAAATAAAGAKRPRADVAAGIDLERDADVQAIRAGRYDMLGEGEAARADNSVGAGAGVDAAFMNRRERRAAGIKGGGGGKGSFASAISSSGSSWLKKLQSGGDDDEDEHKKRQAKRNKSDLQLRAIERIIEDRKAGRAPAFNPAAKAKPAKDQSQNWS